MRWITAQFRFYEELNDFLPPEKRKSIFTHSFVEKASIKDIIESQGVPHAEIDLILVNGQSVKFNHQLKEGDRVSVYPVFESLDISPIIRLRAKPLRVTRFVLDVHLGKLARYLRLLGFDTIYSPRYHDQEIINLAQKEKRIILTRDIGLLKNKKVTHGYWLRATQPTKQLAEIIERLHLDKKYKPFSRCLECNGKLFRVKRQSVMNQVPKRIEKEYVLFYQCDTCQRFYWQGTHYKKLALFVNRFTKNA